MGVKDYDLNPDNNTQINGINIAEGCLPSGINNAVRQLMADVKADSDAQDTAIEALETKAETPASAENLGPVKVGDGLSIGEDGTLSLDLVDAVDSSSTTKAPTAKAVKMAYDKAVEAEAAVSKALPAGSVIAFAANAAPDGYLLCNGATVSRTTYARLFAAIGTTYGAGDGSTTFKLPNLTDKFIQGSGTAGTTKSAGLPDMIAGFDILDVNGACIRTGNFYGAAKEVRTGTCSYVTHSMDANSHNGVEIAAKRYNGIYGASDTVQPPAVTMRYYIKY